MSNKIKRRSSKIIIKHCLAGEKYIFKNGKAKLPGCKDGKGNAVFISMDYFNLVVKRQQRMIDCGKHEGGHVYYTHEDFTEDEVLRQNALAVAVIDNNRKICKLCGIDYKENELKDPSEYDEECD